MERVRVLADGRVGIGTKLPTEALHVEGHVEGVPVVGTWFPSAHGTSYAVNSYNFMKLDVEQFNTAPEVLVSNGSDTIVVKKAGFYRVDLRTITYNQAGYGNHVETWLNGARLHLSHHTYNNALSWRRHATSVVTYMEADSTMQVRVYCNATTLTYCYHSGPSYTALTIQRLN